MRLNYYLSILFVCAAVFAHSQYKRSYNHYYRTPRLYQSFLLAQPNGTSDLVRVEPDVSGGLIITSSNIDKTGKLTLVKQFPFTGPGITSTIPLITGVFDNGNERIVTIEFPVTTTMSFYVLKYNKVTGAQIGEFLHPDLFKTSFVNSIVSGNEVVSYAVKSTGELHRIGFDMSDVTTVTEEVVDASVNSIGNIGNISSGKDCGKITLFNGKEVAVFVTGAKQVYERTAANSYTVHPLNGNSSGAVNFVHLPNGNLFLSDNGDLFELNSNFLIVNSRLQEVSLGSSQSEFGLVNNKLFQFFTKTGLPTVYSLTYDLNLNRTDSIVYSDQKLIDLIQTGNGAALLGYTTGETQVRELYNGDDNSFNSTPVFIDYFTANPDPRPTQEFHHHEVIGNLHLDLGLGNQFFPMSNTMTPSMKYNDSISVVYNMANVYGAISSTDTLGTNGTFYDPRFLPGPLMDPAIAYNDTVADYYNRGFFVSRQMIEDHLDSVQAGNPNYVAPHGISNWPAHGGIGQPQDLAPFVDVNSNGVYEPYSGDYPSIYGDYCFFSITHDNINSTKSAAIEVHSYKYWFDCDTSSAYKNTVFNKCFYFSRGSDFEEFSLGTYSDVDLGNYGDDYVGTNVGLGLTYQYNGDLYDEDMAGRIGFHDKTPATGVMILKGSKLAPDTLDNPNNIYGSVNGYGFGDGIIDNEYQTLEHSVVFTGTNPASQSDPSDVYQMSNYLNGYWRFGDTIRFGGNGFDMTTSIETKYMYPGDSDSLNYGTVGTDPGFTWSEMEPMGTGSSANPTGDRRFIGSTGNQRLYGSDTIVYDIVFTISDNATTVTSIDQAFNNLFAKCALIKSDFNQNGGPCGITFNPIDEDLSVAEEEINDVLVYPNPTNNTFRIAGLLTPNSEIAVYDINGRLLLEQQNINAQTEISLDGLKGNLFFVSIQDGNHHYIKRVIKN